MEKSSIGSPLGWGRGTRDYEPMYITHDGDRSADVHDVGFAHENLLCFLAYFAKQCLVQELFPEELLDASLKVEGGHEVSRVIVGNLRKGR